MKITIHKLVLATFLFAILVAFPAPKTMAQELPQTCTDTSGTFTMYPNPDYALPLYSDTEQAWEWNYIVEVNNPKDLSAITKIYFYAPGLPPNDVGIVNDNFVDIYAPGAGALNSSFGENIYNGITWSVTSVSGTSYTIELRFYTKQNLKGIISPAFALSKSINGCVSYSTESGMIIGGLVGPAATEGVLPSRQSSDQTFTVTEGETTCTVTVEESGGIPTISVEGDCSSYIKKLEDMTLDGKSLVTFPYDKWVKAHSSPSTFTYCYPSGYCAVFVLN